MQTEIIRMINDFEQGRMSRRRLIVLLTGMMTAGLGASRSSAAEPNSASTFDAVDLNHIALTVRDVQRSASWYEKHLGLKQTGSEGFLTTGRGWLALFQGDKPGLHHYCYSIPNYDADAAVARLEASGLTPKRRGHRVYFDDPDGIECQVAEA